MLKNNKFQKEWHSATKPLKKKKIFGFNSLLILIYGLGNHISCDKPTIMSYSTVCVLVFVTTLLVSTRGEFFFSFSKTKIHKIPNFCSYNTFHVQFFGEKQNREDVLDGDVVSRDVVSRGIQLLYKT